MKGLTISIHYMHELAENAFCMNNYLAFIDHLTNDLMIAVERAKSHKHLAFITKKVKTFI